MLIDYLVPLGMMVNGLAEYFGILASRARGIFGGHCSLDRQLATQFAEIFKTTPQFWLRLQDENVCQDENESSLIFGDVNTENSPQPLKKQDKLGAPLDCRNQSHAISQITGG
ncbi:MAG: helix-turn-helix transcriptional regulator [Rhizobiaceae bacterium]